VLAGAAVAAAALARLFALLARPLWFDEIFTAWAARMPWPRLLDVLRLDSGPPFFYVLERPVAAIGGRLGAPDTLLRALSFVAAAALFLAARTLPDASARRRFLVLTAASPLLLVYAAEARPYALLSALGMALFLLSLAAPERLPRLALAALLSAAALFTHYLAILLVASLAAVALARGRRRSAAALLLGAAFFLPWVPVLAHQPGEAIAWMRETAPSSAAAMLSAAGGAGRVPDPFGGPLPGWLLWAGAGVGCVALAGATTSRSGASPARDAALVTVLTLSGALFLSLLRRPVAFPGRTELAVLPIWLWGLAAATSTSRLARVASVAVAAVGALSCGALLSRVPRENPPYVEAAAKLGREAGPKDVAIVGGAFYLPARLASDRGLLASRLVALPEELAAHPGWIPARLPGPRDLDGLERELTLLPPQSRAFVLVPPLFDNAGLRAVLSGGGKVRSLDAGPGALLLVRESASP